MLLADVAVAVLSVHCVPKKQFPTFSPPGKSWSFVSRRVGALISSNVGVYIAA